MAMASLGSKVHVAVTAGLVVAVSWIAFIPSWSCAESGVWEKRYEALAKERADRDAEILKRLMAIAARIQSETGK